MAAHGAVVSLMQLLRQLSESVHFPKAEIESLHDKVFSLQSSLEKIFPVVKPQHRSRGKELEVETRDAAYEAQDAIESFIWRSECDEVAGEESSRSILLAEIIANIDPIRDKAEKLADEIGHGKDGGLDGELSQPRKSISGGRIVGQDEDKKLVMAELQSEEDKLNVVLITGMPGIGKTTLARSIYDDASTQRHFGVRAWVTVTQDYNVGEILRGLLNSIESKGQKPGFSQDSSDRDLRVRLHQALFNTRYLIVIDDMWDLDVWDKVRNSMPDKMNESRVLLTTRISKLADSLKTSTSLCRAMKPLGKEDSWTLLCEKTFGGTHLFPPHLEKSGRKIATNCRGLPLSITVVGGLLSKEAPSVEDWRIIEQDTLAAAAKGDDSYLEILSLSYNHLPGRLKGCFLYMGAFPQDREILASKLVMLWAAEGFLMPSQSVEMVAEKSLEDLVDRNLLRICRRTSQGRIKTCDMHDSLRDLAMQESGKENFFHSVKTTKISSPDRFRRVSIHLNILIMLYQDVYDSIKSITAARTLLYAGHHHHHPMRSCLTFHLLRVLDACECYYIHFPDEVVKLIHLRYLSLTYGGRIPSSLSKLQNLQVLIIRHEPKVTDVDTYLPDEIWNMPQLRHLLLAEAMIPRINHAHKYSCLLFANLQSLSDVHADSCTREVLQNMPNLKKLAMWIDTVPGDVGLYLDELKQLEAFKFNVLNPVPGEKVEFQPEIFFPETLKKLTLRGCGLAWEDMEIIGKLPNLQVLKLRELAFQGEEWRLTCSCNYFESLKFLLLEYVDLQIWGATSDHFPVLESLILRHCYELEEISLDIGYIGHLQLIELVDCSADAEKCAEDISQEQEMYDNTRLHVRISSSLK